MQLHAYVMSFAKILFDQKVMSCRLNIQRNKIVSFVIRTIPSREHTAIARFLRELLVCDVDKLPTDTLIHPFFHMRRGDMISANKYEYCLNTINVTRKTVIACYEQLPGFCYVRFGSHGPEFEDFCYRLLHQTNESIDETIRHRVENFNKCISSHRKRVDDHCSSSFKAFCSSRSLHVTKVVRASMESMDLLLRIHPDTHIIHLVRDPRAVALSRFKYASSARGLYTNAGGDKSEWLIREATIYCRRVVADERRKKLLERQFPHRVFSLTYEELVSDPFKRAVDIYQFIGEETVPETSSRWFTTLAKTGNRNLSAVELASKWRRVFLPNELEQINERCKELIELYPQYASVTVKNTPR
jgi:Sulfotransferase family